MRSNMIISYSFPVVKCESHRGFNGLGLEYASSDSDGKGGRAGIKNTVAGGIAGAAQILATYPMEYVKTQLQLDEKGDKKNYSGTIDCMRKTFKERGFLGFYRGLSILLYGVIPKTAVRFYTIERIRKLYGDSTGQLNFTGKLLCGLTAGSLEAVVAVTPFETIKTKFINDERSPNRKYHGLVHGVSTIIKTEGIHGIYQGVTATVLKQASSQAIRFSIVELFKDWYTIGDRTKQIPMFYTGLFGAIGGAVSVFCNNPIDVIKTRLQGLEAKRYHGTWDCAVKIWQNEGAMAFYKGILPRTCRVSADVAITFMVYDKSMELFKNFFDN